ncbi:rod shape-determining protein MreD [Alicyclobacillus tolerans]|uniref:rod shape-determining protein MreD n=1 Tax=Alicyclobacillus tolerans TaxID=90970 RepID=UPI001F02C887|nr:rod shape-determining protein MreD [Alicyclobacillus tolerans]MCF8563555.1 rod shape-determining protein MreD [Alicyclobacillus tolerans]
MRNAVALVVLWLALVIQSTVFQIPPINVVQPNLVLVVLMVTALARGPAVALLLGVAVGFIQDVVYGSFIGLNAFTYGVIGYFAASFFAQFLHKNISITFLVTIITTFIQDWMTFGLTRMFGVTAYSWHTVFTNSLWQMIVNGITLLVVYPWLTRLFIAKSRGRYSQDGQESL